MPDTPDRDDLDAKSSGRPPGVQVVNAAAQVREFVPATKTLYGGSVPVIFETLDHTRMWTVGLPAAEFKETNNG